MHSSPLTPLGTSSSSWSSTHTRVPAIGLPIAGRGSHRSGSPASSQPTTTCVSVGPIWFSSRHGRRCSNSRLSSGVTTSRSPVAVTSLIPLQSSQLPSSPATCSSPTGGSVAFSTPPSLPSLPSHPPSPPLRVLRVQRHAHPSRLHHPQHRLHHPHPTAHLDPHRHLRTHPSPPQPPPHTVAPPVQLPVAHPLHTPHHPP